jgi:ribosome-binding factor A
MAAKKKSARAASSVTSKERPTRVAAQIRQEAARFVSRELADPRLEGLVVTSVWLSNDLRLAKLFFRLATIATGAEHDAQKKSAQKGLERASGRLRKAITTRLGLRVAPELRFEYDEGQEKRDRIDQLLDEVAREAKGKAGSGGSTGSTGSTGK